MRDPLGHIGTIIFTLLLAAIAIFIMLALSPMDIDLIARPPNGMFDSGRVAP